MKIVGVIYIIILMITSFVYAEDLAGDQQKFCVYSKKEWNEDCSRYKKVKYKSIKEKNVILGCEGPGLGCGASVSFFTKLNNKNCIKDFERLYYNEVWQFRDAKGNLSKIYWKDGTFIYMGNENPKIYTGGTVTFPGGKTIQISEYMAMDRKWFECEIGR